MAGGVQTRRSIARQRRRGQRNAPDVRRSQRSIAPTHGRHVVVGRNELDRVHPHQQPFGVTPSPRWVHSAARPSRSAGQTRKGACSAIRGPGPAHGSQRRPPWRPRTRRAAWVATDSSQCCPDTRRADARMGQASPPSCGRSQSARHRREANETGACTEAATPEPPPCRRLRSLARLTQYTCSRTRTTGIPRRRRPARSTNPCLPRLRMRSP